MSCNHGILDHRSDPKPEISRTGSFKNAVVWSCTVPGCKCLVNVPADAPRPKPPTEQLTEVESQG